MESEPPLRSTFFMCLAMPLALVIDTSLLFSVLLFLLLLLFSALISGAEIAYFGLNPKQMRTLETENSSYFPLVNKLIEKPQKLLATILIASNFINISIVIVANFIVSSTLGEERLLKIGSYIETQWLGNIWSATTIATGINFFITIILVTFFLLLFGEVIPKIYASVNNLRFVKFMARPMTFLNYLFAPLSNTLVALGGKIEQKITTNRNFQTGSSQEDLDAAIELTVNDSDDAEKEADILKGIVKFGNLSTKQVMKARLDVVAVDKDVPFSELISIVKESGYSRLPVYEEDVDRIIGILYVKDLIGYLGEKNDFNWNTLIRNNVIYVPESKKIDDLLSDFQQKRMHMAIVVNEFGGTLGIVTLEDIMEEIIGDIKDEFDEEDEVDYVKLGDDNYIFEGKTLLNDICRVIGQRTGYFDDVKGSADSLAGLMIENLGFIPKAEGQIQIKNIVLKVVSASNRKVEKINLLVLPTDQHS